MTEEFEKPCKFAKQEDIEKARTSGSIDKIAYALDRLCQRILAERDAYRKVANYLKSASYIDAEARKILKRDAEFAKISEKK